MKPNEIQPLADAIVNTRGLNCPLPVLRARKMARGKPAGFTVLIECTDPVAKLDIPHFAHVDGHAVISSGVDQEIYWFLVRIGG
ncbi:MAG: sulfurtransferase TusA family protein [Proteobacteria bacterium]|nr:sulfurtransferase TusA family protein [Pseudomonadota bacterium]